MRRSFVITVIALFLLRAAALVTATVLVVFDGAGIRGFNEWMCALSVAVSTVLILIGVCWLPFSRERAYRWFDWGLLFALLVAQIFIFEQEQLVGTLALAVTLLYWILLRSAMRAERSRGLAASGTA
jgi:hypothetical protein